MQILRRNTYMKRYSLSFCIIILFSLMLFFPQEVFRGASDGLLLWFQIVLPTLLPFLILSGLLLHTNSISIISRAIGPALKKCFHISEDGSFAVLAGFLCGYPMGAKITSDLILTNRITRNEGKYLLSFCNNTSPMFIVSYVIWQNLKNRKLALPSIIILFLSPVVCSFFFRLYYKKQLNTQKSLTQSAPQTIHFEFRMLDQCIMDSFETITKIGGYIMLFSVLISLAKIIPIQSRILHQFLLPMLEITNGIPMILKNVPSFPKAYLCTMALTSFGGFCSIAQTKSMIQDSGLSIFPYIIEKLVTAIVTSLFALFYLKFILR